MVVDIKFCLFKIYLYLDSHRYLGSDQSKHGHRMYTNPVKLWGIFSPSRAIDTSEDDDSTFYWDDSDESLANVASLAPDLPEYDKYPDWMAQLPARLHDVPLSALAIPGGFFQKYLFIVFVHVDVFFFIMLFFSQLLQ